MRKTSQVETEQTSACSEEIGGPRGTRPSYAGFAEVPTLMVSSERRGTLCDGTLHLQLMLSEVPGRSWVEAFCQWDPSKSPFAGVAAGQLPRIEGDQIYWSIRQADLASAWWYLGRCVDRANAACSRLSATRAQLESRQADEHATSNHENEWQRAVNGPGNHQAGWTRGDRGIT